MMDKIMSFVLLCYNQEKEIVEAIKSIEYSGIPSNNYEIIVVDDGSSDGSVDTIMMCGIDKLIALKKNTTNQSRCRNLGVKESEGKYIMFLDGDDYFDSLILKRYMKRLNT